VPTDIKMPEIIHTRKEQPATINLTIKRQEQNLRADHRVATTGVRGEAK
jgi:hypothetical protein